MTKKQKVEQSSRPLKEDPRALRILQKPTESPPEALAHALLIPTVQAAATIMNYDKDFGEIAVNTLVNDLEAQSKLANSGNLARAETILIAHAQTLDTIFHSLARRASLNIGEYMTAADTYLRLALRAQAQCRATLETLAVIKNPQPVAFVRQANIATGPQQVNNGMPRAAEISRAEKNKNQPNKLLESLSDKRLDTGPENATGGAYSQLETLAAIDRSSDISR
jgi:hypothetical protein